MNRLFCSIFILSLSICAPAQASKRIDVYRLQDGPQLAKASEIEGRKLPGKLIGHVIAEDIKYGLLLTPSLHDLPPGSHGFHVHALASCDDFGRAAGGHLDPASSNKHAGPYDDSGHLGDLPQLYVDSTGQANQAVLAPRLSLAELHGHALMIHVGGDNFSDQPQSLGGGGSRLACGVASFILTE